MKITSEQLQQYESNGLLFFPNYFSRENVDLLVKALERLPANTPGQVVEKDGKTLRALHGVHIYSKVYQELIRHSFLLESAEQLLDSLVYLYQFKINMKAAFTGDIWPWHQDYVFWHEEDALPEPRIINVTIFLDDVSQFNGPMYFIMGSHNEGLIEPEVHHSATSKDKSWETNVSANLKYCLDYPTISRLSDKGKMIAPVGGAGSVLFFHSNIAHASLPNISPYERRQLVITYNSTSNVPKISDKPRPDFLVCRDSSPLTPSYEHCLSL